MRNKIAVRLTIRVLGLMLLMGVLAIASLTRVDGSAVNISNADITSMAVGDIDNDGKDEVVYGGTWGGKYWDPDTGTTTQFQHSGWGLDKIAIGNMDGDAQNEIVYVSNISPVLIEYYDAVSGVPLVSGYSLISHGAAQLVTCLAVGDIDNDGKDEVVYGGTWGGKYWDPDTGTTTQFQYSTWGLDKIAIGNMDGDAQNEIVYVSNTSPGLIEYYDAVAGIPGISGYTLISYGAAQLVTSLAVGDIDNDGKDELVYGGAFGGDYWDSGTTTWWNWWSMNEIAIGNIDGDAQNEIVWCGPPAGGYTYPMVGSWDRVSGTPIATGFTDINTTRLSTSLAIGDIDRDGNNEVVYAGAWGCEYTKPLTVTISSSGDVELPLQVYAQVSPQTLNISSQGETMSVILTVDDAVSAAQKANVTLTITATGANAANVSFGDSTGYTETASPNSFAVTHSYAIGSYTAKVDVTGDDGAFAWVGVPVNITLEVKGVESLQSGTYFLNGVENIAAETKIEIYFPRQSVIGTVSVGPGQLMNLTGDVSATDYIDVIEGGEGGSRGKSGF